MKDTEWWKAKAQFSVRIIECDYHVNKKELLAIYKGLSKLC